KGRHFFMTGGHPLYGAHAIKTVAKTVQRVARHSPNAFHACRFECFGDISCNRLFHGSPSPECDNGNKFSRCCLLRWPNLDISVAFNPVMPKADANGIFTIKGLNSDGCIIVKCSKPNADT